MVGLMRNGRAVELRPDPIVDALVPDAAAAPPNATVLRGYLGRSTTPDHWRLYLTPALDRHVDVPADKILHTVALPDSRGTLVWVPKTLRLGYTQTFSAEVQASFLDGAIVEEHLAGRPAPLLAAGREPVDVMLRWGPTNGPFTTCGHVASCYLPLCLR
jgi:hypothetical protein